MMKELRLSESERAEIRHLATLAMAKDNSLRKAPKVTLPRGLASRLRDAAQSHEVISVGPFSWPADALVATPAGAVVDRFEGALGQAAFSLALVAGALGRLLTYPGIKQSGALVQQVFPVQGRETEESAASSLTKLSWHTEHARMDIPPDWLALFCLRNPDDVGTKLAPLRLATLSAAERAAITRAGATTFQWRAGSCEQPILSGDALGMRLRFDPAFQRPRCALVRSAMAKLERGLEASAFVAPQRPGHLLLFSNRGMAHGREKFRARFDGRDRWLLRAMVGEAKSREESFRRWP